MLLATPVVHAELLTEDKTGQTVGIGEIQRNADGSISCIFSRTNVWLTNTFEITSAEAVLTITQQCEVVIVSVDKHVSLPDAPVFHDRHAVGWLQYQENDTLSATGSDVEFWYTDQDGMVTSGRAHSGSCLQESGTWKLVKSKRGSSSDGVTALMTRSCTFARDDSNLQSISITRYGWADGLWQSYCTFRGRFEPGSYLICGGTMSAEQELRRMQPRVRSL